jgi:aspartate/methionine/tyrosine aminotransferase
VARNGYTQTFGAPTLRAAIATTYDSLEAEDIVCFAGAEEAIYIAMQVLLSPDDHCIVITPNYQAAETLPLSICAVSGVPLDEENNWALDVDRIKAALRPNTKLISINFPNNPTGAIASYAAFSDLVELCRARGIWLFNDEVYRLIERAPELRLPQVADTYERGISLNVMSKSYGLPGLRIGWLAARDRDLLLQCERYKHFLSICNSAPSEVLAEIALAAREPILARNRGIVRQNLALLGDFFAAYPGLFDWRDPTAPACRSSATGARMASRRSRAASSRRAAYCCSRRASTARIWGQSRRIGSASALAAWGWPRDSRSCATGWFRMPDERSAAPIRMTRRTRRCRPRQSAVVALRSSSMRL